MSAGLQLQPLNPAPIAVASFERWYALHTRPRHEKLVVQRLGERGVETFLPVVTEIHRWSDRRKAVEMPLFSCYVFARFLANHSERLQVLRVGGVLGLVGNHGEGIPIPAEQIETVRTLVHKGLPWTAYPFLKIGQRVRIRGGAMDGLEGILVSHNRNHTLVISVDAIQKSIAVRLEGYQVEAA